MGTEPIRFAGPQGKKGNRRYRLSRGAASYRPKPFPGVTRSVCKGKEGKERIAPGKGFARRQSPFAEPNRRKPAFR